MNDKLKNIRFADIVRLEGEICHYRTIPELKKICLEKIEEQNKLVKHGMDLYMYEIRKISEIEFQVLKKRKLENTWSNLVLLVHVFERIRQNKK